MEAVAVEVVVGETGDDGGSSLHRILHTHWWILHGDVEVGAGDGVLLLHLSVGGCALDDGGGDGGGLHDLHCWLLLFGSLLAIWRLVLHWMMHRLVQLHVFGNS